MESKRYEWRKYRMFWIVWKQSMSKPSTVANTVDFNSQDPSFLSGTSVSLEYIALLHGGHCPLGIYVIPSSSNLLAWDAVFFVHQGQYRIVTSDPESVVGWTILGYYADAILKFRLSFPSNYPESSPSVFFLTDVFHPLISSTGAFNLAPRFRPWR